MTVIPAKDNGCLDPKIHLIHPHMYTLYTRGVYVEAGGEGLGTKLRPVLVLEGK